MEAKYRRAAGYLRAIGNGHTPHNTRSGLCVQLAYDTEIGDEFEKFLESTGLRAGYPVEGSALYYMADNRYEGEIGHARRILAHAAAAHFEELINESAV